MENKLNQLKKATKEFINNNKKSFAIIMSLLLLFIGYNASKIIGPAKDNLTIVESPIEKQVELPKASEYEDSEVRNENTEETKEFDTAETTQKVIDTSKDVLGELKTILTPIGKKVVEEGKVVVGVIKDDYNNSKSPTTIEEGWLKNAIEELGLQDHPEIQVDGGDTSGQRQSNVRVNVGFGDRDYWAFTNEHGQLTHVIAETIIVQNDDTEPVNSKGRYYSNMANVPGTEDSKYDRGHVIADSLGGVSNAYNITPQEAYLNRHGDQAYMENVIRKANGATNFIATITYDDTNTQTPNNYKMQYVVKGNSVTDTFPNADPR